MFLHSFTRLSAAQTNRSLMRRVLCNSYAGASSSSNFSCAGITKLELRTNKIKL